MKIGIDIRVLARGTRTGVEEYAINLLSRLLRLAKREEFYFFYNAFRKKSLEHDWASLPNVRLYDFKIPNRLLFLLTLYFKSPKIDRLLGGIDVFFNPHYFNAPVSGNCVKITTFHDLSFEYFPELFSFKKRLWQRFFVDAKAEARTSDKLIAVSGSTKQDLIDLYKIPEDRIEVIYSGVGEEFKKIGIDEKKEKIKEKYHLPEKFVLYFGTIEPRKNIIGLIRAFEMLKEKKDYSDLFLVIGGGTGWLFEGIFQAAQRSKYSNFIKFTGFVEPEDKVYLYNLALLFVYPSFFEGFGFPPLEAMACGVPTITSNTSSLPEIMGDAGLMVDPYNPAELAWVIEQVFNDENLAAELSRRGLERAKIFSWDRCAQETFKLIKEKNAYRD
ncbi:MAG: glycosyltransferase family 1 protein [Candidatus Portnoybacteria bacterium]|nr:glycosyltransferase family 1 protein [Candidatus Portnoybacteria bacterium]